MASLEHISSIFMASLLLTFFMHTDFVLLQQWHWVTVFLTITGKDPKWLTASTTQIKIYEGIISLYNMLVGFVFFTRLPRVKDVEEMV